jgi:glutathione S-transferase
MKLYYAETMNPRKACAVAKHLEAPVEFIHVDLGAAEQRRPDYLAINPNGKVPALVDGQLTLWEANAIMIHIARRTWSDLWPSDERQVDVIRWLSWDAEHFSRYAGVFYFEHLIKRRFGLGDPDAAALEEATGYLRKYADVLNDHLTGRRFLCGDSLSVADFAVSVTLPYAEEAKLPLDGFQEIRRWRDRLEALPAWRDPFPAQAAAAA